MLKEIRLRDSEDKEVKEFDKWPADSSKAAELCLSLHYGDQFVLKHISLQGTVVMYALTIKYRSLNDYAITS